MESVQRAIEYAGRGWCVFPIYGIIDGQCTCGHADCESQGKHPRTPKGFYDASKDPDQIRRWWAKWPNANVGIRTGWESLLVVADVDHLDIQPEAGASNLIAKTGRVGGGRHYFFLHPGGDVPCKVYPWGERKADGGYIVAPPSMHISGKRYEWLKYSSDLPVDPPRWVMEEPRPSGGGEELGERIPKGKRHNTLRTLAANLRNANLGVEEIYAALKSVNDSRCVPPIPDEEIHSIAGWFKDKEANKYFETDKKGKKGKFIPAIMVEDIINNHVLITFKDTEETWIYNEREGIYYNTALPDVRIFMLKQLEEDYKKFYADECIHQMQVKTYKNREDMEPRPELLNLENGILNLKTMILSPHNKDYFFIHSLLTTYDPTATAPNFMKFLDKLGCPKHKTLQEFTGYLLLDSPKYKKAGFIYGPTDSGKTTFTNAIIEVLGKRSICSIPLQRLDNRFQIQRLYKKRANIVGDLGADAFSRVSVFRRTTGTDYLEAELKGKNRGLSFVWGGKHLFDANDIPDTIGDADTEAFYNRIHLFNFPNKFEKNEIDRTFINKISTPEERSGILNWMIEGLIRLEENEGFTDKTSASEIRDHWKRASDSVHCFAEDMCEVIIGFITAKDESRRSYIEYCIKNEFTPIGRSKFYEKLKEKRPGILSGRRKIGNETPHVWLNLKIFGSPELVDEDRQTKL